MEFLVMLEESADHPSVLARVDSVPAAMSAERRPRDVVTLYGTPRAESLALALAAAVESHHGDEGERGAFRHLGLWPERGAVGDAAWRDEKTGELVTRDLDIPFDVLSATAQRLIAECGAALQRVVAGLSMPDWPEGAWRAISITLDPVIEPTRAALAKLEGVLDVFREADGISYDYEGD